jgi:hypothetical protein
MIAMSWYVAGDAEDKARSMIRIAAACREGQVFSQASGYKLMIGNMIQIGNGNSTN